MQNIRTIRYDQCPQEADSVFGVMQQLYIYQI